MPAERILLRLEAPQRASGLLAIPFRAPSDLPIVVRAQVRRQRSGEFPRMEVRALSREEADRFGGAPRAVRGELPGVVAGACNLAHEPGDWRTCERFDVLGSGRDGGLLVAEGEDVELRRVEVREATSASPLAQQNPLLHALWQRAAQRQHPSFDSWRDALAVEGGGTYAFDVAAPPNAELRVSLALARRAAPVPARFVVSFGGKVLLDEVIGERGWHDRAVALPAGRGRLELSAREAAGGPPDALFGDPRIVAAVRRPSIVLLTLDAVRPDHLGAYGYGRDTSPNLDLAARAGVVFERATTQAGSTWPSLFSLLTGRYPTRTGVRIQGAPLAADIETLPQMLARHGYETFAGSDLGLLPPTSLAHFDDEERLYVSPDAWERIYGHGSSAAAPAREGAGSIAALVGAQMDRVAASIAKRPTFAWLHLEQAHYPLLPSEPLRYDPGYSGRFALGFTIDDRHAYGVTSALTRPEIAHVRALYDAAIRDADALVGRMVHALIENGVSEDTILVIAADHGELVGEHGITLEHSTPYEGVLHVPLIVVWPRQLAPARVADRVQLVDLAPTLLSLAGVSAQPGLDGRDLSPLLRGQSLPPAPAYSEIGALCRVQYAGDEKLVVSRNDTLLRLVGIPPIELPERALYDVAADPAEAHDLAAREPQRLGAAIERMRAEIAREHRDAPDAESAAIGQAAVEALRQAGYLGAQR